MDKIMLLLDKVVIFLESFGIVGGFLLIMLESIIPILPLGVFVGLNVLAYGSVIGFIISYIGTICGCLLSFILFRKIIKQGFNKIFKKKSKYIEKLMKRISNIDFNALVIILAMPFAPAFVINIAAGLSDINLKKYAVALFISKISIIFFWGYIGTSLLESITSPIIIIKIMLIIAIAYVISKIVEILFKVEE